LPNGNQFDQAPDPNDPFVFRLGVGPIPANSTLIFRVQLLAVR
jgi:FKBP-type peptidyl-prolyl cis-trans isomerase